MLRCYSAELCSRSLECHRVWTRFLPCCISAAVVVCLVSGGCRRERAIDAPVRAGDETPFVEHQHQVHLTPALSPLRSGRSVLFTISITDTANPHESPAQLRGAPIHVVIVNRGLQFFEHLHPNRTAGGYQFSVTFPRDDRYVAFTYYRLPNESVDVTSTNLNVGATVAEVPPLEVTPRTSRAGAYDVSLSVHPEHPRAREWSTLEFLLRKERRSVSLPVNQRGDHQVIIREGATEFVYAHSTQGEAAGGMRGELHLPADPLRSTRDDAPPVPGTPDRYHARFLQPGKYKIWCDSPDGHVATFVIEVDQPESPDPH